MSESAEESVQRWTAIAKAARKHGLTVAEVEGWRQRFLLGAENA